MATKMQTIRNDYRVLRKLYPHIDSRKLRNNVYFKFSAKWRLLVRDNPNSLITAL